MDHNKFIERIFSIRKGAKFNDLALKLFHHQARENLVYKSYLDLLRIESRKVMTVEDIPYLPIELFKSQEVITGKWTAELVFHSSGTTGASVSEHQVRSSFVYKRSFIEGFKHAYGDPCEYILLCLLPNYQGKSNSSLIYMTDELVKMTDNALSGYYLDQENDLTDALGSAIGSGKKVMLLGVSYALLDFADRDDLPDLTDVIVMETGGMKGNRREMVKEELHNILKNKLGLRVIHSEYGMTELLSQAYSKGEGHFHCPPWMGVNVRDVNDPFNCMGTGYSGGLNIIDLANVDSCAFIATQDLGRVNADGSFELLGRFDRSDIRGCNLLVMGG